MRQLQLAGKPAEEIFSEVFSGTAQRLIRFGCTESQAYTLAKIVTLDRDATDAETCDAICLALVSLKEAMDGITEIAYVDGSRRDLQRRIEGRA
jgi:hypothetical protein